ncbi:MAG: hypothetical protein QF704_06910, partial [Anaerolineales bacterium]|nr:hypothetical protein [Anaerolineales bacterium]
MLKPALQITISILSLNNVNLNAFHHARPVPSPNRINALLANGGLFITKLCRVVMSVIERNTLRLERMHKKEMFVKYVMISVMCVKVLGIRT